MKSRPFFPWLKDRLSWPCARKPMINPSIISPPCSAGRVGWGSTTWLNKRHSSSTLLQELSHQELRDRLATTERRMQTCPIAPVQEQLQTVWFHLVHEYLKNKRKAVNDDTTHN